MPDDKSQSDISFVNESILKKRNANQQYRWDKKELCNICGNLVRNLQQHHLNHGTLSCDQCFSSFRTDEKLADHQKIHSSETRYDCDICLIAFPTTIKLALHRYKHTKKYECPICRKFEGGGRTAIKSHIARHEDSFNHKCHICDKGFLGLAKFRQHLEMHEAVPKYKCPICHKKFTVETYLKIHIGHNHKEEIYGYTETFSCEICSRKFTFKQSLKRHLRAVHAIGKDRSAKCPECHKVVSDRSSLQKHMAIHASEQKFVCNSCGKRFVTKYYLNRHEKRHQSSHLQNAAKDHCIHCQECDETFASNSDLEKHMKTHSKTNNFSCELCGEGFFHKDSLRRHRKMHYRTDSEQEFNEEDVFLYEESIQEEGVGQ